MVTVMLLLAVMCVFMAWVALCRCVDRVARWTVVVRCWAATCGCGTGGFVMLTCLSLWVYSVRLVARGIMIDGILV